MSLEAYDFSVNTGSPLSFVCNPCFLGMMPNIDLDVEVLNDNYTINNDVQNNSHDKFKNKGLHFLHVNARSLIPKLSEARILMAKTKAAVLAVTEAWLDESMTDAEIEIYGYVVQRNDRNRNGGGVCLYVRSDIAYNPRPDLSTDDLESLWIDLLLPKTKPILVGVCYRPPKQSNFYDLLEDSY